MIRHTLMIQELAITTNLYLTLNFIKVFQLLQALTSTINFLLAQNKSEATTSL